MGVSYRAITIIGCEIDTSKLYEDVEMYCEGHRCEGYRELREMGKWPKFCPDCGAETYFTESRCKLSEYEKMGTIGGIRIIDAVDQYFLPAYVQKNTQDGSGGITFDQGKVLDTFHMGERLKEILEPLGMWDEGTFGIYTVLDVTG